MSWKLYPPPEDPARNILAEYSLDAGKLFPVALTAKGGNGKGNGKECGWISHV